MLISMAKRTSITCLSRVMLQSTSSKTGLAFPHAHIDCVTRHKCYSSWIHTSSALTQQYRSCSGSHWSAFYGQRNSGHSQLCGVLGDTSLPLYLARTGSCNTRWLSTAQTNWSSTKHPNDDSNDKKKTSNIAASNVPTSTPEDESELGLVQRFKLMYKRYWYVLLPVHVATSVVWYGSFFIAAKSGVDIVPMLQAVGVTSEKVLSLLKDSNAGYYAIAYAMYKVATPARYTVTVGCTTFSINYLKNRGYIKPVPTKDELQKMYEIKRNEMKDRREDIRESFEERRHEYRAMFEERRDEMRKLLNVRRTDLRQRLQTSKDMVEDRLDEKFGSRKEIQENIEQSTKALKAKLEGKKEEMKEKFDETFGGRQEIKDNLEQATKAIKEKLKNAKEDIVSNISASENIGKHGKK